MNRIDRFVHWFISQDFARPDVQEVLLSDPDRADRMYNAAESGADGSTPGETIDDWRSAFAWWIRDRKRNRMAADPDRFIAAVTAHFDAVERWHLDHGTIDQEIG